MAAEVLVDVAGALEERCWLTPAAWIWCITKHIGGSCVRRPEEDLYVSACPFHSVDTATITVKSGTIAVVTCVSEATTLIGRLIRGVDVTVICMLLTGVRI